MIAYERRPLSKAWGIEVAWIAHRQGWLPRNPHDCEWFRHDGHHHVCIDVEADVCPWWVACCAHTPEETIICVRGFDITAEGGTP